jgi:hypothetical protein
MLDVTFCYRHGACDGVVLLAIEACIAAIGGGERIAPCRGLREVTNVAPPYVSVACANAGTVVVEGHRLAVGAAEPPVTE